MKSEVRRGHTSWAVVVAQLVERLLPTPEVRGLKTVIGKHVGPLLTELRIDRMGFRSTFTESI